MAHVRKLLRDAIASALGGLATTGAHVYVDRVYALQEGELPCLLVGLSDEADIAGVGTPEIQSRTFAITVEAVAKANSGLSDTLDQISLEVETALSGSITAGGKALTLIYRGTDPVLPTGEADRPTGSLPMRFDVLAFTQDTTPSAFL